MSACDGGEEGAWKHLWTTTSASLIVLDAAGNVMVRDPESSILSEAVICFL